jgi:endonuclease VIII
VVPALARADDDVPFVGRTVEQVASRGKHLLLHLSGGLVLRTHMRMHGSWHLYRPGERWRRPRAAMRIVLATDAYEAVAFDVPVAELLDARGLVRSAELARLGPDLLGEPFDAAEAVRRIVARADAEIAEVLLDQRALAGIGNVFKSEVLFLEHVHPFRRIATIPQPDVASIVARARSLLLFNAAPSEASGTWTPARRTTGRLHPGQRLWVYGRSGEPCFHCGSAVRHARQGPHARSTYWCEECQRPGGGISDGV